MNCVRSWLLRLAVALLAIQASGFAVPAADVSCASASGGTCTCCRPGSGETCPMCRRAAAGAQCTCSVQSVHHEQLPWLLGITGALPVTPAPLVFLVPTAPVRTTSLTLDSFDAAPPFPPPRA